MLFIFYQWDLFTLSIFCFIVCELSKLITLNYKNNSSTFLDPLGRGHDELKRVRYY